MTVETTTGPLIITGNDNPAFNARPEASCGLALLGDGILDPRLLNGFDANVNMGATRKILGWLDSPYVKVVDAVPAQLAVAALAAAANVTNGTAMTLVTAQAAGISCNIPVVPFGSAINSSNVVTAAIALDLGFTTGTVTSGTKVVTIPSGTAKFFQPGMSLIFSGAGTATNKPLFCKVVSVSGTTLNIDTNAGSSITNGQIATADPTGICTWPYRMGGPSLYAATALLDPTQGVARALTITGSSSATGGAFKVVGYDLYGQPMNETITQAGGTATTAGKKAFKYVVSVTPQFTDAHNYSVGTSDVYGFHLRSDNYEDANIYWNGGFISASTGYVAADQATPTATTGDVRGTYAVQSASDGSKRLAMYLSIPIYNLTQAHNLSTAALVGNTQF